jgi:hypothetical protein
LCENPEAGDAGAGHERSGHHLWRCQCQCSHSKGILPLFLSVISYWHCRLGSSPSSAWARSA